ncbi:hypothetical protein UFOVP198_16 [uncultured Caudovirales phage]|uniref:Uncharacterized protein n=1 Tax=uncultured Caudovirales phage TaxID=2100421 RepID=A0A6J7WL50_9CAUD|nr:hypothetical protein UFOVP198_16 [uncultured Caudovirales phage]
MTPKGKAINLFNSYVKLLPLGSNVERAKQCALIAVDEILNNRPIRPSPLPCASLDECIEQAAIYWKQVKQEIEIL